MRDEERVWLAGLAKEHAADYARTFTAQTPARPITISVPVGATTAPGDRYRFEVTDPAVRLTGNRLARRTAAALGATVPRTHVVTFVPAVRVDAS